MELTSWTKKDKISNLLDPDAKKQTFGRKSQNWPNVSDGNGILLNNYINSTTLPSCWSCGSLGMKQPETISSFLRIFRKETRWKNPLT
ncbi:hypothetical protein Hanom_Chr03g00264681 [Helianthus anomalus]